MISTFCAIKGPLIFYEVGGGLVGFSGGGGNAKNGFRETIIFG